MPPEANSRGLRYSLAARLLGFATVLGLVALVITAFILTTLYRNNIERNFLERLDLSVFTLVATAEFGENGTPRSVPPPVGQWYDQAMSGWYWQISFAETGEVLARSDSLSGSQLQLPDLDVEPLNAGFQRSFEIVDAQGRALQIVEQRITAPEIEKVLAYTVTGPRAAVEDDVAQFRRIISLTLSLFALAFIGLLALSTALALRPLNRVGRRLEQIALGEAQELGEDYPREIAPLVSQINDLIAANTRTVDRARTHVGNLAHALKTPLSVLRNQASGGKGDLPATVEAQTQQMQSQIDYHLKRARAAAQAQAIGVVTPLRPVAEALARAMTRIHEERAIKISIDVPETLAFRGERQDLEEVLGNLLDNACKWARSGVQLSASTARTMESSQWTLTLIVEDDGPGLGDSEMGAALQRGTRLDEAVPGSGLGLAIVRDLVDLYDGALELSRSDLGGLAVSVTLPALRQSSLMTRQNQSG
jgi:signal transduction histidine kinase